VRSAPHCPASGDSRLLTGFVVNSSGRPSAFGAVYIMPDRVIADTGIPSVLAEPATRGEPRTARPQAKQASAPWPTRWGLPRIVSNLASVAHCQLGCGGAPGRSGPVLALDELAPCTAPLTAARTGDHTRSVRANGQQPNQHRQVSSRVPQSRSYVSSFHSRVSPSFCFFFFFFSSPILDLFTSLTRSNNT
jgi:hypothetical protein